MNENYTKFKDQPTADMVEVWREQSGRRRNAV